MTTLVEMEILERSFVDMLQSMLKRVDWLVPLVEAQDQYRAAYYGLTAAALLEDFFFDALTNFANRFRPETVIERPSRGAAGTIGDYLVDGLAISHKNSLGPENIAVHWDATVESVGEWNSETPILIMSSKHSHKMGITWTEGGQDLGRARVAYDLPENLPRNLRWAIVEWDSNHDAKILDLPNRFPDCWNSAWGLMGEFVERSQQPNLIDIVLLPSGVSAGSSYHIEIGMRPGAYLIPRKLLSDIQLTQNNRGSLIPKIKVMELMTASAKMGYWIPLPSWPGIFAGPRPPDLFLPQHNAFVSRFSTVKN